MQCKLLSGTTLSIPLSLLAEYNQPLPKPSAATIEKIKAAVTDLAAEDWKQRDTAEATLVAMGPSVISVLKELRPFAAARSAAADRYAFSSSSAPNQWAAPKPVSIVKPAANMIDILW